MLRFHLKKYKEWRSWRIYPYSPGWFYKSREFPGLKHIKVESGHGGVTFIGKTKSNLVNNSHVTDFTKFVDLSAPRDPLLVHFGYDYDSCNPSLEYDMDDEILRNFHHLFAEAYGCHIPFFGGDRYVSTIAPKTTMCTRKSDYNTTEGEIFCFFLTQLKSHSIANRLLERALSIIPSPPCNYTKLDLESLQVMPWADYDSQGPQGDLTKDTQMVIFMMPRTFEL